MAAPFFAYINKVLKAQSSAVWKKMYVAKVDTSASVMKSRFYLDELIAISGEGVIGAVNPAGPNAAMHNLSTRRGVVRSQLIWFNDGGLNTKGRVEDAPVLVDSALGNFTASATHKSAYYINGSAQMQYQTYNTLTSSWGSWQDMGNLKPVPKNTTGQYENTVVFANISEDMYNHGIKLRAYHQNSEGIFFGEASVPFFATGQPITFVSNPTTYYMNTAGITTYGDTGEYATELFLNNTLTNKYSPSGTVSLYLNDTPTYKKWALYGYSEILDYVCVISIQEWTPPPVDPEPLTITYNGYNSSSQSTAEDESMYSPYGRTIYRNPNVGTAHISYSGSSPNWIYGPIAPAGYYTFGNLSGVSRAYYVDESGIIYDVNPINPN